MTQHIIDTDKLEKLQQYVMIDMTNGVEQCKHGDYVHIDDLRQLLANSPQADDVRKDAERYRWIRANPKLDICGTDEIAEFDAMIDRAIDKARE